MLVIQKAHVDPLHADSGKWITTGDKLPTETQLTIAVDAKPAEPIVYGDYGAAIAEVERRIAEGTTAYRFEIAAASAKEKANSPWTPEQEAEIAHYQEAEGLNRKSALQKMRRRESSGKPFAPGARPAPAQPKAAPKAKSSPSNAASGAPPAHKKPSKPKGKAESGKQRHARLKAEGICTACGKRKAAPKPKAAGGGHYTECADCRAYFTQWAKDHAKKASR